MARAEPAPIAPRLYLLVPAARQVDAARAADDLRRAGAGLDIAAVLLRAGPERPAAAGLRALVAASQEIGAACLIEADAALAAALGADGAHIDGTEALKAALSALRPGGIAGTGNLRTRHDAMVAAEAGADYVMFGEPDAQGRRPPFEATLERVEWWAQLFELPCVAYARSFEEAAALAAAGADFVAMDDLLLEDPASAIPALVQALAVEGSA